LSLDKFEVLDSNDKFKKQNVFINILWKFLERGSAVIVTFIVQIILARILDPSDFGLASMITVFVTISTVFVSGGLSNALVQKKDSDELDFSTIFWFNIIVALLLYLILYIVSPYVSSFYGYPQLTAMLRVLSIKILISAINSIQLAYIAKTMSFRFYFFATLIGKFLSGVIGVTVALLGGGAWALIVQTISLVFFETIILWFRVKWRPSFLFSIDRAKRLYSFAINIMFMSIVEILRDQLRTIFIGKKYDSNDLAYYDKGQLFPTNIVTNISSSLTAVMFPVISNSNDNHDKALSICRKWLSMFAYCVFPILLGLAITSKNVIKIVLTDKWIPVVPYLQFACFAYIAWIIEVPIRETLKALGYAKIILNVQIIKTLLAILILLLFLNKGVYYVALSSLLTAIINISISIFIGKKYLGYKLKYLINDLSSIVFINIVMATFVILISRVSLNIYISLFIQVGLGIFIYLLLSIITKNKIFNEIKNLILNFFNRKGVTNY